MIWGAKYYNVFPEQKAFLNFSSKKKAAYIKDVMEKL
jgi:hypothetical protein